MTTRGKTGTEKPFSNGGSPRTLSRRGFVTMVAAGSAALLARPGLAAESATSRRKGASAPTAKPLPPATPPSEAQKEFDRQRAGTLTTLKMLREHVLPPGGDLPVVFRPQRSRKRGR
jgi:hypothetical protein